MTIAATGAPIDIYRFPDLDEIIATPATILSRSVRTEKIGAGTGEFTIALNDPAVALIENNDVAVVRNEYGTSIESIICEERFEHLLDTQEGARQVATYSGPLAGGVLGWMRIAPALGDRRLPKEEEMIADWRSLRYDDATYSDTWAAATEITTVDDAADSEEGAGDGSWPHQPMAENFDRLSGGGPLAYMIAESGATTSLAGVGWRLYRWRITVSASDAGRWAIEMLMDNLGGFWVDNVLQYEIRPEEGFVSGSFKFFDMTEGDHLLTWAVYNFPSEGDPDVGQGPAGLAFNLYKTDLMNRPLAGAAYLVSSSDVEVIYIGNPFPDDTTVRFLGMTVGDAVLQFVAEAQARLGAGVAPWLEPTFTATLDSAGNPWDRIPGLTTKTGHTSVLQFLEELAAANRINRFKVPYDCTTFNLYAPGSTNRPTPSGFPTGIELEPAPALDPYSGSLILLDRRTT